MAKVKITYPSPELAMADNKFKFKYLEDICFILTHPYLKYLIHFNMRKNSRLQ